MNFSKMSRVCKTDDTLLLQVKKALWEHYDRIQNIWLYEIGHTGNTTISWNDFTYWCKKTGILDGKGVDLSTFDRTFILTNVNTHGLINSAERNLNRYEFFEIIARFAKIKYMESAIICRTLPEAIHKILADCVYPNASSSNGLDFRQHQLYNVKVNEILRRNLPAIEKIYKTNNSIIAYHSKKKYIDLEECKRYVHEVGAKLSEMMIAVIFYESIIIV